MSYHDKIMPELRELARSRGLGAGGNKEDLITRLIQTDLDNCSVDKLKVLLKNRGLPTGGIKKDLQYRLAVACGTGNASLLPGTVELIMAPPTTATKKPVAVRSQVTASSSRDYFEVAERSLFPGANVKNAKSQKSKNAVVQYDSGPSHVATKTSNVTALSSSRQAATSSSKQMVMTSNKQMAMASSKQITMASTKQMAMTSNKKMAKASTEQMAKASTKQMVKASTKQMVKASTKQMVNASTKQMANASIKQMAKASTMQMAKQMAMSSTEHATMSPTKRIAMNKLMVEETTVRRFVMEAKNGAKN